MKFLNKLERKIGRFAIPNLPLVVVVCFIIGYFLKIINPDFYNFIRFEPYHAMVYHQYWRFITWIFTIPSPLSIFTIFMLFFYYFVGRQLEMTWGKFMFNLYVIGGVLLTSLSMVGVTVYQYTKFGVENYKMLGQGLGIEKEILSQEAFMPNYYVALSMFLAFAAIYGETMVLLYFVIPFKIKWLAYIDLVLLGYYVYAGNIFDRAVVLASVANFFIYFVINKSRNGRSIKQLKMARNFNRQMDRRYVRDDRPNQTERKAPVINPLTGNPKGITMHKCAICGRSEEDSEELEFRFCSKCNGNYEYCNEHLFTHEHKK